MKIAFIGGGHITSALVGGMAKFAADIVVVDRHAQKRAALRRRFAVVAVAAQSQLPPVDAVVIAVKPQQVREVCEKMRADNALIISVAAGISIAALQKSIGKRRDIVRVMPNTPCEIGAGMSVCYARPSLSKKRRQGVNDIFARVGKVAWLKDEKMLSAATAISGSGPAYLYYFIEAMEEAAAAMHFPPKMAREMILQTLSGGEKMARHSNKTAAEMRRAVCSKGGTTERAIAAMKKNNFKGIVKQAMQESQNRAQAIGEMFADKK